MLVYSFINFCFFLMVLFWFFLKSRHLSIYNPILYYILFHFIVFVVRPYFVINHDFDHGWWYMRWYPSNEEMISALLVANLALVVLLFVFSLALPRNTISNPEAISFSIGSESAGFKPMLYTAVLLGPLALYSAIKTIDGFDSVGFRMEEIGGVRVHLDSTGYIADAKNFLYGLTIMLVVYFRFKWYSFIPLIIFYFYRLYTGHSRWVFIYSIIAMGLLYLASNRKIWPSKKMVSLFFVMALPVFLVFHYIGGNRALIKEYFGYESQETVNIFDEFQFNKFDTLDFANFDYLTYVVANVPDRSDTYTYGTQYLQLFTEPIPRAIWSDKPLGAPIKLVDLNEFGNFFGLTTSLAGDGWLSGGVVGVIATMSIVGYVLGKIYGRFVNSWAQGRVSVAFLCALPLFIQLYRDGGISIFKFVLFALFPFLLYGFFEIKYRKR